MKSNNSYNPDSIPVKEAAIDDITIAYKVFGEGDALVMINGFGSTMDAWNPPLLEAFQGSYKVILFDSRGMGYSGSSEKPYSIPLFAEDILKLLDTIGISWAHVLGFSLGGMVAQEMALLCPERIRSLILVSTDCGGIHAKRMIADTWKTLSDKSGDLTEQAERMFSILFPTVWRRDHNPWDYCPPVHETTPAEHIKRQSATLLEWQGTHDRLPRIRCPTLVMTGTDDIIIPSENAFMLAARIPAAWLVQLRNGGHGIAYQFPEIYSRIVMTFLDLQKAGP